MCRKPVLFLCPGQDILSRGPFLGSPTGIALVVNVECRYVEVTRVSFHVTDERSIWLLNRHHYTCNAYTYFASPALPVSLAASVLQRVVHNYTELPLSKIIHDTQDLYLVPRGNSSIAGLKITDENLGRVTFHLVAESRNSSLSYGAQIFR